VAQLAGVAVSSASRALADRPSVSPELRARVAAAALELGYRPNLLARGLRNGASLSVGFVVRDISNALLAEIALGAETALRESGYSMLLTNSEGRSDLDVAHIRLFRQRSVDEQHAPTLDELEKLRIPIVLIDREVERPTGLSAVLCDHGAGVGDACVWLTARGHRRIGIVGGPLSLRPGRVCAEALERFAGSAGFEAAIADGPFTAEHGRAGAERLLGLADPPTALIAGSRQILPGVLEAVHARPDVDIVTFDGDALLESIGRPIGVIERQSTEIGRVAAALLLERFDGLPSEARTIPSIFRPPRASGS
jgi:LacI family transcriptional regulator